MCDLGRHIVRVEKFLCRRGFSLRMWRNSRSSNMVSIRSGLLILFCCVISALATRAHALNGQFGLEWSIDAPWRLEPAVGPDGQMRYGSIPIVITFADMNFEVSRGVVART